MLMESNLSSKRNPKCNLNLGFFCHTSFNRKRCVCTIYTPICSSASLLFFRLYSFQHSHDSPATGSIQHFNGWQRFSPFAQARSTGAQGHHNPVVHTVYCSALSNRECEMAEREVGAGVSALERICERVYASVFSLAPSSSSSRSTAKQSTLGANL